MTVREAAQKIQEGHLVVFPTETVYGLGALASNPKAVRRIFEVKGRPHHNPLILHIAEEKQLEGLVAEIPASAQRLMKAFWPGPLTICMKKSEQVSDWVSAGLDTVCVRCPSHPVAQEFLRAVGEPVAAPSANLSGRPSTTTLDDAQRQLRDFEVYFLDGDDCEFGLESTIIDCSGETIKLLRPGSIGQDQLEQVLGQSAALESTPEKITSPGQLLRHYAPQGTLTVIVGIPEQRKKWLTAHPFDLQKKLCFGTVGSGKAVVLPGKKFSLADGEDDLKSYAHQLYHFLNWCDEVEADEIFLEFPKQNSELAHSIVNRLEKAAKGNMIELE